MDTEMARVWLVVASLIMVLAYFLFLILAPLFGYPLQFHHSVRLLEIILPVFLGYLGNASYFVFKNPKKQNSVQLGRLTSIMICVPVIVFGIIVAAIMFAFLYTNRLDDIPGNGMTVDMLAGLLAAALGLLTVTMNVMTSYIFSDVEGEIERSGG